MELNTEAKWRASVCWIWIPSLRGENPDTDSGNLPALDGIFSSLSGLPYTGYEIHMGQSGREEKVVQSGNVYGSYLHGLFDQDGISKAIVRHCEGKGAGRHRSAELRYGTV